MNSRFLAGAFAVSLAVLAAPLWSANETGPGVKATADYVLGPDDQVRVWALGMEELADKILRVDSGGFVDVPVVGSIRAEGLTLGQFKAQLVEKLSRELRKPEVSVNLIEFGSQPVSVVGAVTTPGVHQLKGRKNLAEVIAMAGGLRADAGCCIKISRTLERGEIPLPGKTLSPDGKFTVASLNLKEFLGAANPAHNIAIQPHDVITIPTAELIYVMGAVRKPGAFPLHEQEHMSILQALSLAEGVGTTPALKDSKLLRPQKGAHAQRTEIAVDMKRVLNGKAEDVTMLPNDILFIPTSNAKRAGLRAVEAAIYATTGVIIWRR